MSYNFVEKISRKVNVKYPINKNKLLNEDGIDAYDNGDNPKFRLFCGDRLISSYSEGAFVIATAQVILADKMEKQTFEANIGGNIGSFAELSAKVTSIKSKYNLHGRVLVTAFQIGGDPSQLSKVVPASMSCSFDKLDDCNKILETGILSYARDSLPNQFGKDSAYTPIGDVGLSQMLLDDDYDMELAPSYVTSTVKSARAELLDLVKKNQANDHALNDVLTGYPVPLDPDYKKQVVAAKQISHDNLVALKDGIDCWSAPSRCVKLRDTIKSSLVEQPNKNVINGFGNEIMLSGAWTRGEIFTMYLYPNSTNTFAVELNKVDRLLNYYPTSGGGTLNLIIGTAHDSGNVSRDGDLKITPLDTQYSSYLAEWHWYGSGGGIYKYQLTKTVLPRSLYNKQLF